MRNTSLSLLCVGLLLASCATTNRTPTAVKAASSKASSAPATTAVPALSTQQPVTVPGSGNLHPLGPTTPAASASPGALVASAAPVLPSSAASLTGLVTAPAGIVSNNGGNIISNNGGNIIANNGGSILSNNSSSLVGTSTYRLASLAEQPLAGATVYLLDASGEVVQGPDGKAVSALTDATGRYAFAGDLPTHNFVLAVQLADGKGLLQGILPKDAAKPSTVDIDLVSSLSTTYILGKYVASQTDRQATLDRLPGAVNTTTVQKTGSAFDAAGDQVPPTLQSTDVVPLVDALRQKDTSFDAQMEAVRKLLIVAGVSDLGSGLMATSVDLDYSTGIAQAADGTFYYASYANRIWRVRPDGVIETAVGGPNTQDTDFNGKLATSVGISTPSCMGVDDVGRLLVAGSGQFYRVEPDGHLTDLVAPPAGRMFAIGANAAGGAWVLQQDTAGQGIALYGVGGAGNPVQKWSLPLDADTGLSSGGVAPDGRSVLALTQTGAATRFVLLDASGKQTPIPGASGSVDAAGNIMGLDNNGNVVSQAVGASTSTVIGPWDPNQTYCYGLAGPGAGALVASYFQVYRVTSTGYKLVAGVDSTAAASGNAANYSFQDPAGLTVDAVGNTYVTDKAKAQLLQIDPTGQIKTYFQGDDEELEENAGLATMHYCVGLGLLGIDQGKVWAVDAQGKDKVIYTPPDGFTLCDFADTPTGLLAVLLYDNIQHTAKLTQIDASGAATDLFQLAVGDNVFANGQLSVARSPDTSYWVVGGGKLQHWTAAGGVTVAAQDKADDGNGIVSLYSIATDQDDSSLRSALVVDAQNRVYGACPTNVWRFDPTTNATTILGGAGGALFTGAGVDDSLSLACAPAFDAQGNLIFDDEGHKQIKRIPKDKL